MADVYRSSSHCSLALIGVPVGVTVDMQQSNHNGNFECFMPRRASLSPLHNLMFMPPVLFTGGIDRQRSYYDHDQRPLMPVDRVRIR